jgi:LAGLIDADG endonuclease
MNSNRTNFELPLEHIRITPYWLLGFIEAEGSFYLSRTSLVPSFSLALTEVQLPVLKKIQSFLLNQLDEHSLIKAVNTKLINISSEPASGNIKAKVKLSITQLDYICNIFIPFLDSLKFQSKKKLYFKDFKLICSLIMQGKLLISEGKSII